MAGSRGIVNRDLIRAEMLDLAEIIGSFIVVSGTAAGPDTIGAELGDEFAWPVQDFPANWALGRGAGFIRNRTMASNAEYLLAFHDGSSRGTLNMIAEAKEQGLTVRVVHVLEDE